MREWREKAGAACIVLAMVLGAFAGLSAAGFGPASTPAGPGARASDTRLVSIQEEVRAAFDEGTESTLGTSPDELATFGGDLVPPAAVADMEPRTDRSQAPLHEGVIIDHRSSEGTVRVEKVGTRGHLAAGTADAGGPYGGSDTFEGVDIQFTSTVTSPDPNAPLLFVRWDWNGDGKWDYPPQAGCPQPGCFDVDADVDGMHSFTQRFNDNTPFDLPANVVVEWWDGTSIIIQINTGANMVPKTTTVTVRTTFRNTGWYFTAKVDMEATALFHFKQLSTDVYSPFFVAIWDVQTQTMLGNCAPPQTGSLIWHTCTLPSPISLVAGKDYIVSGHKGQTAIQNWANENKNPVDRPKVLIKGRHADNGPFGNWPGTNDFSADVNIPKVDFAFRETVIVADGAQDGSTLEIHNVAPIPFDITSVPSPALEGTSAGHVASFDDPGTDDTWRYRFITASGASAWKNVVKVNGGAKVLLLDTYSNDATWVNLATNQVLSRCGSFCVSAERFDFGPLGTSSLPTLDYLKGFDVVIVGVNFAHVFANPLGDLLADYMDAAGSTGGGVIMLQGGLDPRPTFGVLGRWQSQLYSPVPTGTIIGASAPLGTIYVPGHPILDGVSTYASGLRANIQNTQGTGVRVADYVDGTIAIATNENPMVNNGARACAFPMFPILGFATGDANRVLANAIRYCSRQVDPTPKTMPILLDPVALLYPDDHPTSVTPDDQVAVTVEVMDDDHAPPGVTLLQDNLESGSANWVPTSLWHLSGGCVPGNSPPNAYRFNVEPACNYATGATVSGTVTLSAPVDPTGVTGLQLGFAGWQETEHGPTEGQVFDQRWVEVSTNNGASWSTLPWGPAGSATAVSRSYQTWFKYSFDISGFASTSTLLVRFRFNSVDPILNAFRGWFVDDVRIGSPVFPNVVDGLGTADGFVTIANVAPTIVGGFNEAFRVEGQTLEFKGFQIQDPAIIQPTESFSWAIDLGDGSPLMDGGWHNLGSLAPTKSDVMIVHTLCTVGVGTGCAFYQQMQGALLASDTVRSVSSWNFIDNNGAGGLPVAPDLNMMLQHDVILVATNFAYLNFPPFDLVRRQVGDRLAAYIDAGRGGVLSMMAVYDISAGLGDIFSILGRYIDDDYGAFEKTVYDFVPQTQLGQIYDPEHDLFVNVGTAVGSASISPGDMPVTSGGAGQAAGVPGVLLADWPDGGSAIGAKTLLNGERTAHLGLFWSNGPVGSGGRPLLRNAIGWVAGGIPSPRIPAFTHTYGDNGIYTVDIMVVDDDMGMLLGAPGTTDAPTPVLPGASIAHRTLSVAVDNVDPLILTDTVDAFIATQVCLEVGGTVGNTVSLEFFTDGGVSMSLSVTRVQPPDDDDDDDDGVGGVPDGIGEDTTDDDDDGPAPTVKCGLDKVDVLAAHQYGATLSYSAPNGGTNPTRLVIEPWRQSVMPDQGRVTKSYAFGSPSLPDGSVVSTPLPTLKQDMLARGQGAVIDFGATAVDAGTDDLAFFWVWSATPGTFLGGIQAGLATSLYTVHIHHNSGVPRTDGVVETPQFLGFSEPYFDRPQNMGLSPLGTMEFQVRDTATHAFQISSGDGDDDDEGDDGAPGPGPTDDDDDGGGSAQLVFWVVLIVLDDDNTRGYASSFSANDGVDMHFLVLDFR